MGWEDLPPELKMTGFYKENKCPNCRRLESVNKNNCTLGVGDGAGSLFVHGDYDSIKAVQKIIFERDKLRASYAALMKAAELKRNVIIKDADPFKGRWVAIPEKDFNKLRALLTVEVK
jgi:hypothetical protein